MRTEDVSGLAPLVLGALVRRYGHFDLCEDAVQEALLAAARQWPEEGRPDDPKAWLIRVGSRRLVDLLRSQESRQRREEQDRRLTPVDRQVAPAPDADPVTADDDALTLLVLCCHPALSPSSQVALTLRAVGGLTTAEIARAFFVPEATMAQRISRAKATIRRAGATFALPDEPELGERMRAVLHVLYLVFNEGYAASSGAELHRRDLTAEAVRLAREVHRLRPADAEVAGLLALMLLTEARRAARVRDGDLVPLDEQDRDLWDRDLVAEGVALVEATLAASPALGPYQLQAAIAAVHDEAPSAEDTDWHQVLALYDLLERVAPNPMTTLNRAVAVAEVHGPSAGLAVLDTVADDERLADHHRLHAARAFLLERAGEVDAARDAYREAVRRATSRVEQRHLERRLSRLR
ncbi:sigma-70 family RNA polymerase sigma factor [Iamia sp. SCSIO 61187]|uniref:RNA polymerase sigma factor n=1 Tax=Iamia sp. SCSIO 61187 TaxID=2722752 RepID=UPI001C633FAE|nr:sigma-70 family RNA polymerase sigma factor [Iamia sp. SCSIO 61187]QYG91010.1 sigma-70 family RNA polymerase sigma factor [Iamia sp. SCSIO 61187]